MNDRGLQKLKDIIKDKIDGIWIPEHDSIGHHYRYKDYPDLKDSVTQKLQILSKPHLTKWAVKMGIEFLEKENRFNRLSGPDREELVSAAQSAHTDVRDDAGAVGTVAHDAIEQYIKTWIATGARPLDIRTFMKPECDPRSIASARAVQKLFVEKQIIPVASEILVGHQKYSAGTLDFLCFWEGQLTLVDWKTSNAVDKISYSLQVAAYLYFFKHMTKIPLSRAKIIHLSKDYDKFDVYNVKNLAAAWKTFKAVCQVYDWMRDKKEKIEKDVKRILI